MLASAPPATAFRVARPSFIVPLVLPLLAASIGACQQPGDPCSTAAARVAECIADFCAGPAGIDDLICQAAARAPATSPGAALCDGDRLAEANRVAGASCAEILDEAHAAAGGKADAGCPWYFPWCAELAPENAPWDVHVLEATSDHLTLQIDVDRVDRRPLVLDDVAYEALALDGAGSTGEVGFPDLPVIGLLVGIPWDTTRVEIDAAVAVRTEVLEGVAPTPFRPLARDDQVPAAYTLDGAAYADFSMYPRELAAVEAPGVWRDYRVVRLAVHPVLAVTGTRQVIVNRTTLVTLRFAGASGGDAPPLPGTGEPMDEAYAGGLVNYETAAPRGDADDPRLDLLAVVEDALAPALAPLLDAKRAAGQNVKQVLLSEIGATVTPEAVKAKIAEIYTAEKPQYVLLVGTPKAIPMHTYQVRWDSIPSDAFYSFLEGDDLLADVALGRLPADTPEKLTVIVNKTLAYLAGDPQAEWRRRFVTVAHKESYPGKYTECVKSILGSEFGRPIAFTPLIGGEGATNEQLTAAINEGAGVVSYRGHGDVKEWAEWGEGGPYVASAQALTNADRTPVVFSVACLTGALHQQDSLAEQFVLREGGGAVAFLGATEPSYTTPNHDFNRYLFNGLLLRNEHRIGVLSNLASAMLLRQYGGNEDAQSNVKMYLWAGDPSLEIGLGYRCDPVVATPDAGPDVTVIAGTGATIGALPAEGTTYSWSPATGLSCTDCARPIASPAVTTTYTVTARNGCSARDDAVTVTVEAPPPAPAWCNTQWPLSLTVKAGAATPTLFSQLKVPGITPSGGASADLRVEIGFGPQGTMPADPAWTWTAAAHNAACSACGPVGTEEWMGSVTPAAAGVYNWAARVAHHGGEWIYCDRSDTGLAGSWDGWSQEHAPTMVVDP